MNQGASLLIGEKSFQAFSKSNLIILIVWLVKLSGEK